MNLEFETEIDRVSDESIQINILRKGLIVGYLILNKEYKEFNPERMMISNTRSLNLNERGFDDE